MNSITQSDLIAEDASETAAQPRIPQEVVRALRALLEDDAQEQRETFDYLKRVLDEDRPF
jgi:hypothetical protein